ncbi:hypothetical protein LN040_01790 [Desulfovibrio subterraneus]|jgi:hypothetical protein|uniref:hypothetical protein n=1 Tax=Desulfovibrio subterraneus TaxID=2718620 RepID=UPI0022B93798|nr:hypothetical protein [Desulfovibrio subterraneus]WBF67864.1 hypothetical protein LN040_01790 [Desulfovibrio subterraneus]
MPELQITVLDPDTRQVQQAAGRLRALLRSEGVPACVHEVSCYLEISRRGLADKTPAIAFSNMVLRCTSLDEPVLRELARKLGTLHGGESGE